MITFQVRQKTFIYICPEEKNTEIFFRWSWKFPKLLEDFASVLTNWIDYRRREKKIKPGFWRNLFDFGRVDDRTGRTNQRSGRLKEDDEDGDEQQQSAARHRHGHWHRSRLDPEKRREIEFQEKKEGKFFILSSRENVNGHEKLMDALPKKMATTCARRFAIRNVV